MRKTVLLAVFALLLASCGGGQKPTPRPNVWGDADSTLSTSLSAKKVRVPFQRTSSNLIKIQVSMNGVPLNMIWDSGASLTCISAHTLKTLALEGKVTLDDYLGSIVSSIADGSSVEDAVFHIHEIYIQGKDNQYLRVTDLAVAVSANDEAPLLLGQDVMKQLPQHTFNESTQEIEFYN